MPSRTAPEHIQGMFNAIAPTYDRLNHLMSFGLDIGWRRRAVRLLAGKRGGVFLDIAAGSGDVSLSLLELRPRQIVAADFAYEMLRVFEAKRAGCADPHCIDIVSCDALSLPFRNASFDGTIVAFGMRNFADRLRSLQEMRRVLKPGGISVILELTKPRAPLIAQLYTFYSSIGLPLLGRFISHHNSAYRYLPSSIAQFPVSEEFCLLMNRAGFPDASALPLTFGAATIFTGTASDAGK